MQPTSLDKIRQVNDKKADSDLQLKLHKEQLDSSDSLQRILFDSFNSLVSVLEGNGTKGEAIGLIVNALEKLDKDIGANKTETALIKSGLSTLEEQLKDIPTGELKQIPKFLEQRETVKVSNLDGLESALKGLETAIKAQKLSVKSPDVNVQAPEVHVPAPVVNVPAMDLEPLQTLISEVKTVLTKLKSPSVQKTEQQNTLISEKFDEYKVVYAGKFDDDEDTRVSATQYFLAGKKVATLKYSYDKEGNLTGVKKA
jgi:hypothetical protein